jgi:hypothetical protein
MLASIPASILNHIRAGSGIPFDSEKISHALAGTTPISVGNVGNLGGGIRMHKDFLP